MSQAFRFSPQAWGTIFWRTAKHMLVAVIASVLVSYLILETFSQGLGGIGLIAAIIVPLALGGPMVFYMSVKQYELQMAYQRLESAAARDSLTNCFHHGAFVDAVTTKLNDPDTVGGALLVVDADHFKSINDRFGHASGDIALKLIVSAIRGVSRHQDIVGRLGGEEFGVFLPGAEFSTALEIAEAIRSAVEAIRFEAGDETCALSVSIGGAICAHPIPFNDLFRHADRHLYKAKDAGRNNVDLLVVPALPESAFAQGFTETGHLYRGQPGRKTA